MSRIIGRFIDDSSPRGSRYNNEPNYDNYDRSGYNAQNAARNAVSNRGPQYNDEYDNHMPYGLGGHGRGRRGFRGPRRDGPITLLVGLGIDAYTKRKDKNSGSGSVSNSNYNNDRRSSPPLQSSSSNPQAQSPPDAYRQQYQTEASASGPSRLAVNSPAYERSRSLSPGDLPRDDDESIYEDIYGADERYDHRQSSSPQYSETVPPTYHEAMGRGRTPAVPHRNEKRDSR